MLGTRVIRGPDWSHRNQDGGAGHVGTVVSTDLEKDEENTVTVQWDSSKVASYKTKNRRVLNVIDNAQTGVKHVGVLCCACNTQPIRGLRWKCAVCKSYNLCTQCYMSDAHFINHQFYRIDVENGTEVAVPKRFGSKRMNVWGIFIGAKVREIGEMDPNVGSREIGGDVGHVLEIVGWKEEGTRNAVKVKFQKTGLEKIFRLGYGPHVDVKYIEESSGGRYYIDHLPVFDLVGPLHKGAPYFTSKDVQDDVGLSISDTETKCMEKLVSSSYIETPKLKQKDSIHLILFIPPKSTWDKGKVTEQKEEEHVLPDIEDKVVPSSENETAAQEITTSETASKNLALSSKSTKTDDKHEISELVSLQNVEVTPLEAGKINKEPEIDISDKNITESENSTTIDSEATTMSLSFSHQEKEFLESTDTTYTDLSMDSGPTALPYSSNNPEDFIIIPESSCKKVQNEQSGKNSEQQECLVDRKDASSRDREVAEDICLLDNVALDVSNNDFSLLDANMSAIPENEVNKAETSLATDTKDVTSKTNSDDAKSEALHNENNDTSSVPKLNQIAGENGVVDNDLSSCEDAAQCEYLNGETISCGSEMICSEIDEACKTLETPVATVDNSTHIEDEEAPPREKQSSVSKATIVDTVETNSYLNGISEISSSTDGVETENNKLSETTSFDNNMSSMPNNVDERSGEVFEFVNNVISSDDEDQTKFSKGDVVMIKNNLELVKKLQKGHGEWCHSMASTLGEVGEVKLVYPDGDLRVHVLGDTWTYNPKCVTLIPDLSLAKHKLEEDTNNNASETTSENGSLAGRTGNDLHRFIQTVVGSSTRKQTSLHRACLLGNVEEISYMLDAGQCVDTVDDDGDTPVHHCVIGNQEEALELILKRSTNSINLFNNSVRTPLHIAAFEGYTECVNVLLKYGCDVNLQDSDGNTPLHNAINGDHLEIMYALIDAPGIDLSLCNNTGLNVLHFAALKGFKVAILKILNKRPDLKDVPTTHGDTARQLANLDADDITELFG